MHTAESATVAASIDADLLVSPEPFAAVYLDLDAGPRLAVNTRWVVTDHQLAAVRAWAAEQTGNRHALYPVADLPGADGSPRR